VDIFKVLRAISYMLIGIPGGIAVWRFRELIGQPQFGLSMVGLYLLAFVGLLYLIMAISEETWYWSKRG
jgi:hypothetical protein